MSRETANLELLGRVLAAKQAWRFKHVEPRLTVKEADYALTTLFWVMLVGFALGGWVGYVVLGVLR